MSLKENSIFKTLIYSDIFDFPLTLDEIYLFLVSSQKISKEEIKRSLSKIRKIERSGEYYFLKKRKDIISLRKKREKESRLKIKNNLQLLKLIGLIPSVKLLGVSGSVAFNNAKKEDDLDLFIITKKDTLWVSRFLIICMLLAFGKKRSVHKKNSSNKICANMFIDESALLIGKKNLFIAKEIVQVMPIVNKDQTHEIFLQKNNWIKKYLANFPIVTIKKKVGASSFPIKYIDNIFFTVQKKYMENKITNEKIGKNHAWFHPNDISGKIDEEFLDKTRSLSRENPSKKSKLIMKNRHKNAPSYNTFLTPGY